MTILDHALLYARRGIRIIPIAPGEKYPAGIEAWQTVATSNETTITEWFTTTYKNWGVGICTGRAGTRQIFVLDIDEHNPQQSGSDTLNDLETEHGKLPDTVTVLTPQAANTSTSPPPSPSATTQANASAQASTSEATAAKSSHHPPSTPTANHTPSRTATASPT